MSRINNAPARYEGPYCQLGALLREEAKRHIEIADAEALRLIKEARAYAEEHPEQAEAIEEALAQKVHDIDEDAALTRLCDLESRLWDLLRTGWMRVERDWSRVWFWNPDYPEVDPETGEPGRFELWSQSLCKIWLGRIGDVKSIGEAYIKGQAAHVPETRPGGYLGKGHPGTVR
jgi:hypothetical protein